MIPDLAAAVPEIFLGKVRDRWAGKPPSAIGKVTMPGPRRITPVGIEGDEQADLEVHGGTEKAIHHYPADHYPLWRAELADRIDSGSPMFRPGGFGENLTTSGLTEDDVCIGDIFTWGTAELQISQGRQPCWKLAAHTDVPQMAYLVQKTMRVGWYYRVLTPGQAEPGDVLRLTGRPHPGYTVRRVTHARLSPRVAREEALAFAGLAALYPGWRDDFREKAG